MPNSIKREILFRLNKPQEYMLYPVYLVSLIVLVMIVFLGYVIIQGGALHSIESNVTLFNQRDVEHLGYVLVGFLVIISLTLCFVIYWAYLVSNRILGAYDRIIRELDLVLDGKRRRGLSIRKGDMMFDELLKRINALIDKVPNGRMDAADRKD